MSGCTWMFGCKKQHEEGLQCQLVSGVLGRG